MLLALVLLISSFSSLSKDFNFVSFAGLTRTHATATVKCCCIWGQSAREILFLIIYCILFSSKPWIILYSVNDSCSYEGLQLHEITDKEIQLYFHQIIGLMLLFPGVYSPLMLSVLQPGVEQVCVHETTEQIHKTESQETALYCTISSLKFHRTFKATLSMQSLSLISFVICFLLLLSSSSSSSLSPLSLSLCVCVSVLL